jgi:heme oxygenase (biliverdin-IX-beta and delta-forming)
MRLKALTAGAHQRLEALAGQLFDAPDRYRRYLQAMHAARAPMERALDDSGADLCFPEWPRRRIAHLVTLDLADLGARPHPVRAVPRSVRPAAQLGWLYVLEGSALGARILLRQAGGAGLSEKFGARHLAAQTADPGAWRRFVAVLEAADLSPEEERACERGALDAFGFFAAAYGERA